MHDVTSRYTKYFNRRYSREGHLFQERFRAVLMEKQEYALPMTAYVHSLPARAGLTREFTVYPYSSCAAYLDAEIRRNAKEMAEEIDAVLAHLPVSYDAFLSRIEPQTMDQLEQRLSGRILGSEAFVAAIRLRIKAAQGLPASEPPVAATKRAQASAPLARRFAWHPARVAWASGAASVLLALAVTLQGRLGMLERTIRSLAKENESLFNARGAFVRLEESAVRSRQLAGSEWEMRILSATGESLEPARSDSVAFNQRQMTSAVTLGLGFASSNYTLTPQPDGSVVWETMQTNPSGEVVCWRGVWKGDSMRGVLTRQMANKGTENFSFIGIQRGEGRVSRHET
jgi:hypothetical protein